MRIRIISPSDSSTISNWWGDYWVKKDLQNEFIKRGYEIVDKDADLDFCLLGKFQRSETAKRRFCWLYSHVDNVINRRDAWIKYARQFEHIFVLSNQLFPIVQQDFKNSSVLLGASSKKFSYRKDIPKYDIGFIGNAGKPARIEIIKHLISLNKYKINIGGTGWDAKLGYDIRKVNWIDYIENEKMGDFFNNARVSFYSSHEDMRKNGLVAVRILDIFRSSECLCISDENPGLNDIFNYIPTYKTKEELVGLIDWYLGHPVEADDLASACRDDVSIFTFKKTVDEIERFI